MIDYESIDNVIGSNWYDLDPALRRRVVADAPPEDLDWSIAKLRDFGGLCGDEIARNADIIDRNPPRLVRYDRWAEEVDDVEHHPATLDSKRKLWKTGYVSLFATDEARRGRSAPAVVLAGVNYLLSQADTGMVCSLGMTSGVAGLVASYAPPDLREDLLAKLRSDDFVDGADGSMFLTERAGGSDLGRTIRCVARDIGDGRVLIDGEKWFCSNIDGEAIVMLARPDGASEGASSIGLYLVPKYLDDGSRNRYRMRRLKDKLGTRSVPTGEVEFDGALGYALRPQHRDGTAENSDAGGLNRMMEMVNGSRFGVAMMGLGIARRSMFESLVWAHHREAKGRLLVDLPLAREQLVDQFVELEAAFALGFECAAAGRRPDGDRLRRILVPASKVRLCRLGVEAASYAVELVGGNGYDEGWGLTRLLRDAQCHPIWEGSENICMLDVQRAIRRDAAHEALLDRIDTALARARSGPELLAEALDAVGHARDALASRIATMDNVDADWVSANAARLTTLLVQTTSAALLVEQGADDNRTALVALRYVRRNLTPERRWDDRLALVAGREIMAFGDVDDDLAARAAAIAPVDASARHTITNGATR
jgi:alkylation response protein AidB-like acyl-CoA dehydrogenase